MHKLLTILVGLLVATTLLASPAQAVDRGFSIRTDQGGQNAAVTGTIHFLSADKAEVDGRYFDACPGDGNYTRLTLTAFSEASPPVRLARERSSEGETCDNDGVYFGMSFNPYGTEDIDYISVVVREISPTEPIPTQIDQTSVRVDNPLT